MASNNQQRPSARPQTDLPGLVWPNALFGSAAVMEVLQCSFRESEHADPAEIRRRQHQQIGQLAAHAHAHSPFWRSRLQAAGYTTGSTDADWFSALPLLTRQQAKAAGDSLFAHPIPAGHGRLHRMKTSGSTGTPLQIIKTGLAQLFWHAFVVRDALWHHRNLQGKLAAIRVGAGQKRLDSWGPSFTGYQTGSSVGFDARTDIDAQLDWLLQEQPHVLLTHASNLRALARRSIERGCSLVNLQEARCYSERPADDLRELVTQAWQVPLTDLYSASEVGYIALQCPQSSLLHVQSEGVLVEVLDDAGRPCRQGEAGRVVVTPLHNFAMPLLRYDLGDHAIVAGDCPCGRTLPTLERVLGRTRNMLRLPGGGTAWTGFPMNTLVQLGAIEQVRMIQHSLHELELELVLSRPLTSAEEQELRDAVIKRLGHPFNVRLSRVERIERGPGHKLEDFICRMD